MIIRIFFNQTDSNQPSVHILTKLTATTAERSPHIQQIFRSTLKLKALHSRSYILELHQSQTFNLDVEPAEELSMLKNCRATAKGVATRVANKVRHYRTLDVEVLDRADTSNR